MKSTPPDRADAIFGAAHELPPEERESHIVSACGDDALLLAEVRAMLAAHEDAPEGFLDPPKAGDLDPTVAADGSGRTSGKPAPADYAPIGGAAEPLPPGSLSEKEGDAIGPYKLLQQIGEGGFGTVWMAEQSEPISRKVALKVVKAGMDTREVLARFEAERQALAMMDHPNIARVLDAGATESGRPYFAMELVKGIPITTFCDGRKLDTRQRLELFRDVCAAVNHAHQKGVIHRDIKPSNVMVTLHGDKPVVKVIDFGIAKATQAKLTDKTLFTRFEQFLGTPVYMSPEQAAMSGLDIDTRSDIYALGVLLYELISGRPPFDPKTLVSAGYDEMRRIIQEDEPPRPSVRLGTVAGEEGTRITTTHGVEPRKLGRLLKGELDWIIMKAIEKDRARRYETANAFSLDIGRFLSDEPVQAAAPSAAYRFRKFARRHQAAVGVGLTIAAVLVVATIVSTWQAAVARRAKDDAERARFVAVEETERATAAEEEAREQKLFARRRAYAADLLLCQKALEADNLREARQLLNRQRPGEGEEDLRGWEWRRLWADCRSDALYELGEHENRVVKAVYVDEGRSVVTFQDLGLVRQWNLETREGVTLQESPGDSALGGNSNLLGASEDGRWIAAEGKDGDDFCVRVWDLRSQAPPRKVSLGKEKASAVAISPDGATVAAFMVFENAARVWDVVSGKEIAEPIPLGSGTERVGFGVTGAIRFSPNGGMLAVGDHLGRVRVIDAATWTSIREYTSGTPIGSGAFALDFSPDSRLLAFGGGYTDTRILIWDVVKDEAREVLFGHAGFIAGLAFSPDGSLLASASGDQTIKLWDTNTWEERATLLGHIQEVWSVAFSPDGEKLISGGKDRRVQVWSAVDLPEPDGVTLSLPEPISFFDAAPDGRSVVAVSDGAVKLTGAAGRAVPEELGTNIEAAFWAAPGEIVAGSKEPFEIKVWNLDSNRVESFPIASGSFSGEVTYRYLPVSRILVARMPHENTGDMTLLRWDAGARRMLSSSVYPAKPSAMSQDGKRLATHDWTTVSIYDLDSADRITSFEFDTKSGIQGMALSPDGKQLAVATRDEPKIMIWDVDTGLLETTIHGHNLVILNLAYSQDGTRLLSSAIGGEPMKLWDTRIWEEVSRFDPRSRNFLFGTGFLSDGATISAKEVLYGHAPGLASLRLWRAPAWEEIAEVEKNEFFGVQEPE